MQDEKCFYKAGRNLKHMPLYEKEINRIAQLPLPWQNAEGKAILLSGATGMIGKCLVDILMKHNDEQKDPAKTVRVIALSRNEQRAKERFGEYWDREDFQYVACDVNEGIPETENVDYVVHAASNTHPLQYANDSIGTIASNIIGTKNLLDYAIDHETKRFCFVSSVEVYGENRGDVEKFDESYLGYIDCNTLRAGYPESKRLGETLCNAYFQTYGLDFVIPRLSRVYGPTMLQSDSKAISQFIKKAADGEEIVLKSEGNQKYSYSFVTDAVAGILYTLLLGECGQAYNIADKKSDITLKELAECLAQIAGTKVIFELPDESESRGYSTATKAMLCADKLEQLGWRANVHMEAGLAETVASMKNV